MWVWVRCIRPDSHRIFYNWFQLLSNPLSRSCHIIRIIVFTSAQVTGAAEQRCSEVFLVPGNTDLTWSSNPARLKSSPGWVQFSCCGSRVLSIMLCCVCLDFILDHAFSSLGPCGPGFTVLRSVFWMKSLLLWRLIYVHEVWAEVEFESRACSELLSPYVFGIGSNAEPVLVLDTQP